MTTAPHPRTDLPHWAQSVDDYTHQSTRRGTRIPGSIGSIVVNALLLYAANHLLEWQVPWITPVWSDVLWTVDLTLEVSIAANVLFLLIDTRWFRNLAGAISSAVAVMSTWWVYTIFPFDLGSAGANDVARLALLAVLVATGIAALVMTIVAVAQFVRAVAIGYPEED
jgi:hypothetical protein